MGRGWRMAKRLALYHSQEGRCAMCGGLMLIEISGVESLRPKFATIDHSRISSCHTYPSYGANPPLIGGDKRCLLSNYSGQLLDGLDSAPAWHGGGS